MPRPGKEPLKRLNLVKGPVYRHCSLSMHEYVRQAGRLGYRATYYRAHGSPFVPFAEAAANFFGSNPVMEGRGAMMQELDKSGVATRDRTRCNWQTGKAGRTREPL